MLLLWFPDLGTRRAIDLGLALQMSKPKLLIRPDLKEVQIKHGVYHLSLLTCVYTLEAIMTIKL